MGMVGEVDTISSHKEPSKHSPEEVPEFFRNAEKMVAHCSYDPDLSKDRGTPHARQAEYGEHYIDIELLGEHPIPEGREAHIKLCAELGLAPRAVGTLPYALAEWTERPRCCFRRASQMA